MHKLETLETGKMMTIEDNEFQGIGKNTPYKAPDGFFEQVSEKTLEEAKQREQNHRKNLVLWRTVAVAATMVGIALFGYYMSEPEKTETKIVSIQEKQIDSIQSIQQIQGFSKQPAVAEIKKAVPEKTIAEQNNTEAIGDVLADLSDEELMQLAAMYKSDPFISESEQ